MAKDSIDTIIGNNTIVEGDMKFTGGLHIDGTVVGGISADGGAQAHLTLSETGRIEGKVNVPSAVVNGVLEGDLVADRVELAPNARVKGNVTYRNIQMSLGAQVNGQLAMQESAKITPMDKSVQVGEKNDSGVKGG